jgi:hypothetical protein
MENGPVALVAVQLGFGVFFALNSLLALPCGFSTSPKIQNNATSVALPSQRGIFWFFFLVPLRTSASALRLPPCFAALFLPLHAFSF